MTHPPPSDDLVSLRVRVIEAIRRIVTWGGLLAAVAAIAASVAAHDWHEVWIVLATYAALMALNWWPGASIQFRAGFLVFVCFASGAMQLLIDATHGSGYQLLLASVVLGGLLLDRRMALLAAGIVILADFVITGLYGLRIISSPDPAVGGVLWWLSWSVGFAVIAGVLVTTQQYIAGQLAEQLRQLRKLSAAKDDLLAMVSHELRTPLTPVLLILNDLQRRGDIPEQYREEISLAREQIELEARLVNDLLDLTRVVSHRLELRRSSCDVHAIIPSVLKTAQIQLNEKRLSLHQNLSAAECIVDGDAGRLHQVLRNLLDNAIKFTPPGGSITLSTGNENGCLILRVRDTGIGMDARQCQRAFELFEQKDRSITREYGGMGVGLTLCRALVEGHGGEIWASSEGEGKGSTITIRLPSMPPAAAK